MPRIRILSATASSPAKKKKKPERPLFIFTFYDGARAQRRKGWSRWRQVPSPHALDINKIFFANDMKKSDS
jgi:hypothetical protein